jgi:hypothetical protein
VLEFSDNKTLLSICLQRGQGKHQVLEGASFLYILKTGGDKTEPCGTPACISLGVGISPSTEPLNFLYERKEPISLNKQAENSNSDNLFSKPECHVV